MFPNLRAEMARNNISPETISIKLRLSRKSIANKLSGRTEFTRAEMSEIKKNFFPELSLDYLFESEDKTA